MKVPKGRPGRGNNEQIPQEQPKPKDQGYTPLRGPIQTRPEEEKKPSGQDREHDYNRMVDHFQGHVPFQHHAEKKMQGDQDAFPMDVGMNFDN